MISLLGPPGSGKGTQAELLAKHFRVPHISLGAMLREAVEAGGRDGRAAAPLLAAGRPVSVALMRRLLRRRLNRHDVRRGFVGDGLTRTAEQAKTLDEVLHSAGLKLRIVIYLEVPESELRSRLRRRRVCPACGASYGIRVDKATVTVRCLRDGSQLHVREDDREELIQSRLSLHREITGPLVQYYTNLGLLERIDGCRPVENVASELLAMIGDYPETPAEGVRLPK